MLKIAKWSSEAVNRKITMQWTVETIQTLVAETLQGKLEIEQHDKNGGKLECYRRVGNSCSISDKRSATLVANPVISRERTYIEWWQNEWELIRTDSIS